MGWKTIRRQTGLIEHVCEHGCGHPNAGSIQYTDWYFNQFLKFEFDYEKQGSLIVQMPIENLSPRSSWAMHGCDGCCSREDFPGRAANAIQHAFSDMTEKEKRKLRKNHFVLWWGLMAALAEAVDE